MSPVQFTYPATPANVPGSVTEPTKAFKKEVGGVMGSIVLFFIVYILMLVLSLILVVASFYGGIAIISGIRHWLGILAGIGLMGLGVMVFIFLVKFIFTVNRYDHSGSIEISEVEQPELFNFIRRVAKDTQAPYPKRIYISPDVNAAVFYDSSFWSMFLPVRKNLIIGLGLVNTLNISEFKAVIAHEFGHFSQRSMKLGSFVYNVNKIIYNMLYENKGYSGFLGTWANISGVFALFASATVKIAEGIQWILSQMYGVINKSYMRLSREMEFHADAVAASVSGSKSLVTALRRVELASSGYEITLKKCDELYREKLVSENIYYNQRAVLKHLAEDFKLTMDHGIPVVTDDFIRNNNTGRLNVKDQWASHPTTTDREQRLNELAINAEIVPESAWFIFRDKETFQKRLTDKIYESIPDKQHAKIISSEAFEKKFNDDIDEFSLPPVFHGFYDQRWIEIPENLETLKQEYPISDPDTLFTDERAGLSRKIKSGESDLMILNAIAQKNLQAKSFDFDGVKYQHTDASAVAANLEQEITKWKAELKKADNEAISFFLNKSDSESQSDSNELTTRYTEYFELRKKADAYLETVNAMFDPLQPIYGGQTLQIEVINRIIGDLKSTYEPKFKRQLKEWIDLGLYGVDVSSQNAATNMMSLNYAYFDGNQFFENELHELNNIARDSWDLVSTLLFRKFKAILVLQAKILR